MPMELLPDLTDLTLEQIRAVIARRRLPPVERWHPAEVLDSQMEIRADGSWWHQGGPITRPAMVQTFAGLLMRDDAGQHWLVTPQDRQTIAVQDAAFIAVDVFARDGALVFRLNTDELVIADADHRLTLRGTDDAPAAYLHVRHGVEARLNRSTWAQVVDMALDRLETNPGTDGGLAVESLGITFPLSGA
ncbi:DUF1285 domain-containing protein [Novosphingobium sp. FSY-8]|uniref:DUF1285 domain-containing protein n=1 Tax=Novosphingobium ovatum TaxID=1908523 RepID=A0ABW9XB23_9SPHN|nr:DUF1285 domain-containing protein [Novosphingobium ovatum]NBC35707.1 DUF1285 domain-containing protein [Novosphingobium ovatum]